MLHQVIATVTLLTVSSVVLLGLAIATVLPSPNSKPDLLGYRTLCAFVPVSTAILLGVAGFLRILRDTLTDTQAPRGKQSDRKR